MLGFTFISCGKIPLKVKDAEVCSVAGVMAAGAECVHTLSDESRSLNLDQWVDFLEPQEAKYDSDGKLISPERGGALCMPAKDWEEQKTFMESACKKLGEGCTVEVQQMIKKVRENLNALKKKVTDKKSEGKKN